MSTVALMWEARAADGRGNELLEWARAQVLAREPVRREVLRAAQDRVLVITWWEAPEGLAAELPELPEAGRGPDRPGGAPLALRIRRGHGRLRRASSRAAAGLKGPRLGSSACLAESSRLRHRPRTCASGSTRPSYGPTARATSPS